MNDDLTAPQPEQPPQPKSRVWLWIAAALAILTCLLLLIVGIPVGGALYVADRYNATATGQVAATQTSEADMAQPPPGWKKLVGETFDSNLNHWDTETIHVSGVTIDRSITDGRYVFDVDHMSHDHTYWEYPGTLAATRPARFFLAVETRQLGGSTGDNWYGLMFRSRGNRNYSLLEVQDNGYVSVDTYEERDRTVNIPWTRELSITPGEFNRLVVMTDQDSYVFLVNDHLIGRISNLAIQEGGIGMFIYGRAPHGVTYEFDNFQLYVPQEQ